MADHTSSSQRHIDYQLKRIDKSASITEARFALLVAKHTSINVVDHITKTVKACLTDSAIASSIQLSRTKCAAIIKNVWNPHFRQALRDDIDKSHFSLLIDESTDISIKKQLGIVIKYFSRTRQTVVGSFLKLEQIEGGDAQHITAALKSVVAEFGLDLQKCSGIGTDNASVMVGRTSGVYARLKREVPHLILVPCVCHSLQLAISEVCKQFLPAQVEFLVAETFNWFSRSTSRQQLYTQIYNTINDGHDPLKIVRACQTRWLSVETAVTRILDQWLELKTHFEIVRVSDNCFVASQLCDFYKDELLKSYLIFVKPHLQAVQRVNKLFQSSSNADMSKLFNELCFLIEETANVVTVKRRDFDPLVSKVAEYLTPNPNLGYEFELHLKTLLLQKKITSEQGQVIRTKCVTFLVELVNSLRARLPDNISVLRNINLLSVERALRIVKPTLSNILEELLYLPSTITKIEMQWKNLPLVKWTETKHTLAFWAEVRAYRDAGDNNPFNELTEFAFHLLTLPFSNAEVERVFSQLNLVKNKCRNRMQGDMVNAILMIRSSLSKMGKCCEDYPITPEMVAKVGESTIYSRSSEADQTAMDLVDVSLFN